jgi:transposase
MDIHKNARLSFRRRESLARLVIEQGATQKAAAAAFCVSAKTAAKWMVRFRVAGLDGLRDRNSKPHRKLKASRSCCRTRPNEDRRILRINTLTVEP